jgi:beta-lactamase superfamily II metal-dependent hydrolase
MNAVIWGGWIVLLCAIGCGSTQGRARDATLEASTLDGGSDVGVDGFQTEATVDDATVDGARIDGWQPAVEVTFFDVGQGDSTLVHSTQQEAVLFDTGRRVVDGQTVGSVLWPATFDYVALVISHYDADHMGAADRVFCGPDTWPGAAAVDDDGDGVTDSRVLPGEYGAAGSDDFVFDSVWDRGDYILPQTVEMEEYLAAVTGLRYTPLVGDHFDLGLDAFRLEVISVDGELLGGGGFTPQDENDRSIALLLSHRGFHLLLPGDLCAAAEIALAEALADRAISLDVLHTAHHGSATSTAAELLDLLQPEVAIISVGDSPTCGAGFNAYGHPSQQVLDRLQDSAVSHVFQTQQGGAAFSPGTCDPETGETYPRDYGPLEWVVASGDVILQSDGFHYRIYVAQDCFVFETDE